MAEGLRSVSSRVPQMVQGISRKFVRIVAEHSAQARSEHQLIEEVDGELYMQSLP